MSYGPPSGPQNPGGYGPPPSGGYPSGGYPGGGYPGGQPAGDPPNNWMWAAIVSLLCCTLFGIISLIFSLQVSSRWRIGDFQGAQEASDKAKLFGIIGLVGSALHVVFWICYILFFGALFAATPTYY
ncbi:CD225/dispanin family protein [Marinactinospora thermotolerans]|uniref:Predicted membrane protein n=1 Tax=Marinactinospora thermotolerans DSM 45154 TaxID=1122192 RepID=A0A1T4KS80_9ACTN|nr:CD225/dispanin family protein [Marinactinospora thermotolerans]SJZ45198.1 Predicted membrane protein [Marinactinospora thermotolerans DSM 45154]